MRVAAEAAPIFANTFGVSLQLDANQIGMIIAAEIGGGTLAVSTTIGISGALVASALAGRGGRPDGRGQPAGRKLRRDHRLLRGLGDFRAHRGADEQATAELI